MPLQADGARAVARRAQLRLKPREVRAARARGQLAQQLGRDRRQRGRAGHAALRTQRSTVALEAPIAAPAWRSDAPSWTSATAWRISVGLKRRRAGVLDSGALDPLRDPGPRRADGPGGLLERLSLRDQLERPIDLLVAVAAAQIAPRRLLGLARQFGALAQLVAQLDRRRRVCGGSGRNTLDQLDRFVAVAHGVAEDVVLARRARRCGRAERTHTRAKCAKRARAGSCFTHA